MLKTILNNRATMLAAFDGISKQQRKPFFHVTLVFSLLLFFASCSTARAITSTESSANGTLEGGTGKHLINYKDRFSFCGNCPYVLSTLTQGNNFIHLKFTTTQGYGRTGNYVIAMRNALNLAYLCKAVLELPAFDHQGNAFSFSSQRFFDFRSVKEGSPLQAPECANTEKDTFYYWFLQFGTHHRVQGSPHIRRLPAMDAQASTMTNRCLQQYLGICSEEEYCRGLREDVADEQTVVVHVRHGDIYPSNFSSKHVLPEYGQPPLSFYLSIFDFVRPKRVIIVGEPSFEGPVWKALQVLQKHKALRYHVEFRSEQFRDDFRLMICAKTFVESRSTLMSVVRLGFASRIFTSEECHRPVASAPLRKIYSCDASDDYKKYYLQHENSAAEWVDALLQSSQVPRACHVR